MARRAADVTRLRANQTINSLLLEGVRAPARDTADREDAGEAVTRNGESLQDQRRIELDVGVELPSRPVLDEQRQRLGFHGLGKADAVLATAQRGRGCLE